jgi:hypothetical protein
MMKVEQERIFLLQESRLVIEKTLSEWKD